MGADSRNITARKRDQRERTSTSPARLLLPRVPTGSRIPRRTQHSDDGRQSRRSASSFVPIPAFSATIALDALDRSPHCPRAPHHPARARRRSLGRIANSPEPKPKSINSGVELVSAKYSKLHPTQPLQGVLIDLFRVFRIDVSASLVMVLVAVD